MSETTLGIKPFHPRIVVEKLDDREEVTPGGIFIPHTAQRSGLSRCKVLVVNDGATDSQGRRTECKVDVGDTILVSRYVVEDIKAGEYRIGIVHENEILAVLSDPEPSSVQ